MSNAAPVRKARPTSEGLAVLGLTVAIGAVAAAAGNNLLYLVVAVLLALWLIELVLGSWNLRSVDAVRRLPAELVAEADGTGRIVVRNRRRWLPAVAVLVQEEGTGTEVTVGEVAASGTTGAPAVWRFGQRGPVRLEALTLTSRFPLGWVRWEVRVPAPADLVVFPRPVVTQAVGRPGEEQGTGGEAQATRGGVGDFVGLRAYQPGDRLHGIHWRTTARAGEWMVVQRGGEAEPAVQVVLERMPPEAWEGEISRAAGEIGRGFSRGWRVGLEVPTDDGTRRLPAQGGGAWRRTLLEVLARLPEAR